MCAIVTLLTFRLASACFPELTHTWSKCVLCLVRSSFFPPSCLFVLGLCGPIDLKLMTGLSLLLPSAGITGMIHHAQYSNLIFVLIIKYPNEKQLKGGMVRGGRLAHSSRLKSGKCSKQLFTSPLRAMRNRCKNIGIQLTPSSL